MPLFNPTGANVPAPRYIGSGTLAANITNAVLAANTTYLQSLEVLSSVTVTGFIIGHGSVAAGNLDLGIYDVNGNLLGHTGVTAASGANSSQTLTLGTPFAISPGNYYTALWVDNATDTYYRNNYGANLAKGFTEILNGTSTNAGGLLATFTAMGGTVASALAVPFLTRIQGGF